MLSFHSYLAACGTLWAVVCYKLLSEKPRFVYVYLAFALLVAAVVTALGAAAWQIVYYRYAHPLKTFPGPFWASVTRLWLARVNYKGREAEELLGLHEQYGPVVRITPTMLSLSETSMLPLIYHRAADKTEHYAGFVKGGPESFFNIADHKAYVRARKVVGKPFTPASVKKLEPLVDAHINHWLTRLTELHAQPDSPPFDFAHWATYLGFDVITDLAFGASMGFVESASDVGGLIRGLHTGWLFFGLMSRLHPFKSYMSRSRIVKKLLGMKPSDKTGFGVLMKTRDRIIEERLAARREGRDADLRADVLQGLLDAKDEQGRGMDMDTIRQEVLVILIAGGETTGVGLTTVLNDMLEHPEAFQKCTKEILEAYEKGLIGSPPTVAEVNESCPYFIACVKETLRLHPTAPGVFPRLVSEPGIEQGGRFIPPGTEVAANVWVVARDKGFYGEDAAEWRPERWLGTGKHDVERIKEMNRLSMSWGMDRACLGKEVAMMDLCKAGVEVLRRFEWEAIEGGTEKRWIVKAGVGWWEGITVRLRERSDG